ncbi:MAG: acyltransferase family protein, partial [Anaerolineales bacterium]
MVDLGYLAVDFFFALSGFVIAATYTSRLEGGMSAGNFIAMRIIRFYPIYLAGHGLGLAKNLALQATGNPDARSGIEVVLAVVLGLFMLPVPLIEARNLFPLNAPAWTLFLELLVNIAFALGLFRCSTRVLAVIMALSAGVLLAFTGPPLYFDVGYSAPTFLLGVARLGFAFPAGMIVFRGLADRARIDTPLALIPLAVLCACLLFPAPEAVRQAWEVFCVFALFPALLALGVWWELPRAIVPVFGWLGAVSYAVYALHGPLILFVYKGTQAAGLGLVSATACYLAVLLALAYLVSRF